MTKNLYINNYLPMTTSDLRKLLDRIKLITSNTDLFIRNLLMFSLVEIVSSMLTTVCGTNSIVPNPTASAIFSRIPSNYVCRHHTLDRSRMIASLSSMVLLVNKRRSPHEWQLKQGNWLGVIIGGMMSVHHSPLLRLRASRGRKTLPVDAIDSR